MSVCKRCNRLFECKMDNVSSCQCSTISVSARTLKFLEKTSWGCLCTHCHTEIDNTVTSLEGETFPKPSNMKEGFHYYMEGGLLVFTGRYHMLRGACCSSGCRHCPYGFKK